MLESPRHNPVNIAAQHTGDILNRFALTDTADVFGLDVNYRAAQVRHRHLEAYPRPQRRLFKQHRKDLAGQAQVPPAAPV